MKKFIRRFICILMCVMACINTAQASTTASHTHTLKYSIYKSTPSDYLQYNCYNYAIGQNKLTDPGVISNTSDGAGDYSSFSRFVYCIQSDIRILGGSATTTTNPNAKLADGEYMLAYWYGPMEMIKPDSSGTAPFDEMVYHFWVRRYDGGAWTHKYGAKSGIMQYIGTPSDNWSKITDEYCNSTLSACCEASLKARSDSYFGYMIVNRNIEATRDVKPVPDHPSHHTGELDHSAAAVYSNYHNG